MRRILLLSAFAAGAAASLALAGTYGATLYYAAGHGTGCADCHEMADAVNAVHGSAHGNAQCMDCHEASVGDKLRHVRAHVLGKRPDGVHLREADVRRMMFRCQGCHQQEYASWHAGPHSATYSAIFTSAKHNASRRLNDDCFRCHGMYFDGAVRDIVQPQNTRGPWHLTRPELADQPAIPCQSCHWIHREGTPQTKPAERISVAGPAVRDSLAFYDRREQLHFRAASLPNPQLYDGPLPLKISPDPRQAVCYQCHAPRQPDTNSAAAIQHWGPQAGSGDDRTPMGVHQGLSCAACHAGHNESARASCATCHPALSNCGLDVEKMDTTFANAKSAHDIHWVKCADCHQHGIPRAKQSPLTAGQ
ncbi:MAG TPA: hypothetical protein VG225_15720 [Terracidiphilus sp.]|jgi:hypothetical protein|nr:hypothetical protein [Terracidiphilus sp.]